jgi:hypothetical protein
LSCFFGDGKIRRSIWKPSCESTLFTRNKLYKYEITKKVPTYRWVVEYCCNECQAAAANAMDQPPTPAPANSAENRTKPLPLPISSITPPVELDMPQTVGLIKGHPVQPAAAWVEASK